MDKIKCHICKATNSGTVCRRCGADLGSPAEQLVLKSGGYTLYSDAKNDNRFSHCRVAFTNKRLVIYSIKPEADNPAFGLFKDLVNAFVKNPYISIALDDIESIRRYEDKYIIATADGSYLLWVDGSKGFDELFAPYKQSEERG